MLLHYKVKNIDYTFLIKNQNETDKYYIFLITRNEEVQQRIIEEALTLYLIKTDLVKLYNLIIIVYRNKSYLSKIVDIDKFRQLHFTYHHRICIKNETKIDEKIIDIFRNKIDIFYSLNIYLDRIDYDLLVRDRKKNIRLKAFKKYKKKEKFKKLFPFSLFYSKIA